MRIKENMYENILNTIMDVKGKTNDNMNARMSVSLFCHHKDMKLVYDGSWVIKPESSFTLDKNAIYLSTNDLSIYVFLMNMF